MAKLNACEMLFFAPYWLSRSEQKDERGELMEGEAKVHFAIFCNCAQFLMKSSQRFIVVHNGMAHECGNL